MNAKQFTTIFIIVLMGAAGSIVAAQSGQVRQPQSPSASANPADRKWEYRIVTDPSEDGRYCGNEYLQKEINQLADQRYEIVSVQSSSYIRDGSWTHYNEFAVRNNFRTLVLLRREKQ
jgi:hypothetical protein